jgi:hypothetical protein
MRKLNELRLRHWQRVAQLGFWRYTLLCTLAYGAVPILLVGGFRFGIAEYYAKMWLYKRHHRTLLSRETTPPSI